MLNLMYYSELIIAKLSSFRRVRVRNNDVEMGVRKRKDSEVSFGDLNIADFNINCAKENEQQIKKLKNLVDRFVEEKQQLNNLLGLKEREIKKLKKEKEDDSIKNNAILLNEIVEKIEEQINLEGEIKRQVNINAYLLNLINSFNVDLIIRDISLIN